VTTGLVIGKFLPPHRGHEHLVRFASARVDRLSVILFTKAADPIPGDLREAWMRELFPDVDLRRVTEEHSVDFADPAAWALWIGAIRRALPAGPDLVFSSEGYGDELARRLGARHVLADRERRAVPVSGTEVRADPLGRWEHLPPCVRPHFARRVAVVGAESTGKSTLAAALASALGAALVPEGAREYLLARGGVCLPADLPAIAEAQAASEEAAARSADRVIVCDTDPLTTALWSERYFGAVDPAVGRLADAARYDLTLLCENDLPWVPDGLRDSPGRRGWFRERFARELGERGRTWRSIAGTGGRRRDAALEAVAPLAAALSAARRARPSPTRSGGP
jgi:NadR type nicotinamide-nucleotide adenylyltransferase